MRDGGPLRALFVSLPALGHALPLSAVAGVLGERGHAVAWVSGDAVFDRVVPHAAPRFAVPGLAAPAARGTAMRSFFAEVAGPAADAMVPAVDRALRAFSPDVLVVEQNCLAGAIAADRSGLPWVCVHVTPILLTRPFRQLPGLEAWVDEQVAKAFRTWGLAPRAWPIRSPHGTLVPSSSSFLGPDADLVPSDILVGSLVGARRRACVGEARIVVTLGTRAGDVPGFADRVARLAELGGVQVVDPAAWAPVPELVAGAEVVVSHGGQNTVTEALAAGVPLVLAPLRHDQPLVAARVAALGAGRVAPWERGGPDLLRDEVAAVLADASYRAAAQRLAPDLADGTARAADCVEAAAR